MCGIYARRTFETSSTGKRRVFVAHPLERRMKMIAPFDPGKNLISAMTTQLILVRLVTFPSGHSV